MSLIAIFLAIWAVLVAVNYFIGLAVESMWGSGASLLSFLALFFASIFVSWRTAVRLSAPKAVADQGAGTPQMLR